MDFFKQQADARKQTKKLVFYFLLAITAIVVAINLVFYFAFTTTNVESIEPALDWFAQPYWIYISLATLGIIFITSLTRSWQINSDPEAIIKMVNATPISPSTKSRQERQLVNIVEEMSLASGMPIPKTYIMTQEQGINAFVSGLAPSKAILVVTQGLLDQLNRSQLQGVIGHEFSHILNGDMRLNLRLMGVIAGILVIGQIGQTLLRSTYYSAGRSRSSSKRSNGGAMVAVAIGIFVVGYIGLFFGRIIKAAVSRQREYLADASAIQFTRDREGIAGALLNIRNSTQGSQLVSDKAEEMSHMCFGESTKITQFFSGLLASHPPLEDRIQAVYPGYLRSHKFDKKTNTSKNRAANKQVDAASHQQNFTSPLSGETNLFAESFGLKNNQQGANHSANLNSAKDQHTKVSQAIADNIGKISPDHLQKAEFLLQSLKPSLLQKVRGEKKPSESIISLIILFALANRLTQQDLKLSLNKQSLTFNAITKQALLDSFENFTQLNFIQRHAMFNIALSKLVLFSSADQKLVLQDLKQLLPSTSSLSAMGLASYAAIMNRLEKRKPHQSDINSYKKVAKEINFIFQQLLTDNDYQQTHWDSAEQHLNQLIKGFGIQRTHEDLDFQPQTYHKLLNRLSRLKPMLKQQLILTVTDAIQIDNKIGRTEYAYLRLLCEYLDCPIPLT